MKNEVVDYYDEIAEEYDNSRFSNSYGKFIHQQEEKYLKNAIKSYSPKTIVSIGCGTGRFMELANIGVDYSSKMLEKAQQKFSDKKFICADASQIPLDAESVDLTFSLHVFMHLSEGKTKEIFEEIARVTSPDGIFIFDIPSFSRRNFLGDGQKNWHGASAYELGKIKILLGETWEIISWQGILFLPIHRFPKSVRPFFQSIDNFFCRSFLKKYASYLIFTARKK
jgi:SAM-dependent methyltransferase